MSFRHPSGNVSWAFENMRPKLKFQAIEERVESRGYKMGVDAGRMMV